MTVKQITQEQYDERFYENSELVNPRTENNYFPSVSYVLNWSKAPAQLIKWWKNLGHYADDYMEHRANVGSYVHNAIEHMIKDGAEYTMEMIDNDWSNPNDSVFVKRCFQGFYDWLEEMKKTYDDFKILESEGTLFGSDYAGTTDLIFSAKGQTILVDFKTSKQINDKHEIQVESYRRGKGCDLGATLKLGSVRANSINHKFNIVKTSAKQDRLWAQFTAIKELFYLEMSKKCQPTREQFNESFKLLTK